MPSTVKIKLRGHICAIIIAGRGAQSTLELEEATFEIPRWGRRHKLIRLKMRLSLGLHLL